MAWWNFKRGVVPQADTAMAEALQFDHTYLPYAVMGWPQFRVRKPFQPLPFTPQLWADQYTQIAGLGGLISGGIVFQQLGANPNYAGNE